MPTNYDGLIQKPATFETGRERGLLSNLDSITSSPLRKYIYEKLNKNPDAFGSAWNQVGKDPETSPTGYDIAKKLGATDKPVLDQTMLDDMSNDMSPAEISASRLFTNVSRSQLLGMGADLALDPTNYIPGEALAKGGMMAFGGLKKVGTALKEARGAKDILSELNTLEKVKEIRGTDKYKDYLGALDEVYGPSAKRSKDLGFEDKVVYHGTTHDKPIEAFKESPAGGVTGKYGKGVYVTDYPEYANQYANHGEGSIYPLRMVERKEFHPADADLANKLLLEGGWVPEVKSPRILRSTEEGLHLLEKNVGKKELSNVVDDAGYRISTRPEEYSQKISAVKPNELRSTQAAFDPRFKDSPDLLAGFAPGMMSQDDDESSPRKQFLKKLVGK